MVASLKELLTKPRDFRYRCQVFLYFRQCAMKKQGIRRGLKAYSVLLRAKASRPLRLQGAGRAIHVSKETFPFPFKEERGLSLQRSTMTRALQYFRQCRSLSPW
ncbi:MAG: hypothetical protein BWY86_00847 [Candidatus Aminicenantes bacterium ADurb.Bin508]|nr:MAG: hypothetical protein BWY86_00847 [Candidatus Aminicenantes bacterium ADurb.Bin508]